MDDDIAKHLGLAPLKDVIDAEIIETTSKPLVKADISEADRDYKYARDNFIEVISTGHQALQDLLDVASQSQHPRAYEVLAATMKTLIDANKELVELSRRKQEDEKPKEEAKSNVTNNNLFVGTPAELQKMLKSMRNESD
jgi:hypothetical protein